MKFSENEKKLIRILVESRIGCGEPGFMILKKYIEQTNGFGLFYNPSWDNGEFVVYKMDNNNSDSHSIYEIIEILLLFNKLIDAKYVFAMHLGKDSSWPIFLFENQSLVLSEDFKDKEKIETSDSPQEWIEIKDGEWYMENPNGGPMPITKDAIMFTDKNITITDILFRVMFASPDLETLVDDNFVTYEEKEAKKAKTALKTSIGTTVLAFITLIVNAVSVYYAREQANSALQTAQSSYELNDKNTKSLDSLLNNFNKRYDPPVLKPLEK